MNPKFADRVAMGVFVVFAALYLYLATYVCQDISRNTFDVIQGVHVFDVDDTYRLFLAREPFQTPGLWMWNFILPVNVAFDGLFSWLTGHDVFWMRASHIVAVLASLYLVYRGGRHLGISAGWMLASCVVLLVMPLYVLLSMSFYGESLMAAAMGVAIYALATDREKTLVGVVSFLPLIRPEGFFFLVALFLKRVQERRFASAAFMVIPGFIFFCVVMYSFGSMPAFFAWRDALSAHYPLLPNDETVMGHALLPYYTVNPLWWLAGLAAVGLPVLRRFRPFFAAAVGVMLHWAWSSYLHEARGEARYFFAIFPLLALSMAAGLDALAASFATAVGRTAFRVIAGGLLVFVCVENTAQIDQVRFNFFSDRRWPIPGERGAMASLYIESPEIAEWRVSTARFVEAYTLYDRSIKKVMVHAFPVFNELKTENLSEAARVEFAPMTPKVTFGNFGGTFYTMFPAVPQYQFYRLSPAPGTQPNDGQDYALYVGPLYNGIADPLFANPVFQVYKVRYEPVSGLSPELFSRPFR